MLHSSEGFDACKRLLKASEFKYVFSKANKISNYPFIVLVRKNEFSHSRLGLAISKKAIKLAVQRNRIKRLIRETFRKNKQLNASSFDIVIMARNNIFKNGNKKLITCLNNDFEK